MHWTAWFIIVPVWVGIALFTAQVLGRGSRHDELLQQLLDQHPRS